MFRHFAILCLVASCFSAISFVEAEVATKEFLIKQKIVYELLWHLDQPELSSHYDVGRNYSIEENMDSYTRQDFVEEFLDIYKRGMLPRGEIFSEFYETQLEQAVALFKVLYYSKDFDTLYKTAAWARIYLNEGLFVYAFCIAVIQHPLTQHIRLPAHHEIYPHLHFDNEIIRKAYDAKMYHDPTKVSTDNPIIVHVNHSKSHYHEEYKKLSYFTDDIDINDLLYHDHLVLPFWMSTEEYGLKVPLRGELFFMVYTLMLARYNGERFANDLDEIEDFDWSYPIPYGYTPSSSYHNGVPLPHREAYADIQSHNYKWLKTLQANEYLISLAINWGHVVHSNGTFESIRNPGGLQILGNLIEGNADSINRDMYGHYEKTARKVLGFSPEPFNKYKVLPSILEHYGLDQRDPIFWSFAKKLVSYYDQFVSKLPKYTHDELAFSGVKIESVDVDRVETYFAPADYLISGAMKLHNAEDRTLIKARQYRLNQKPFTYTITVNSDKEVKATIFICTGPKYNAHHEEIDITDNYNNFFPLDKWNVDLKVGSNEIKRNSLNSSFFTYDQESADEFYRKIVKAIDGTETYEIPRSLYAYPGRIALPKGKPEGYPYQLFVFISPSTGEEFYSIRSPLLAKIDVLNIPSMFPLDRSASSNFTDLSNAYFKTFNIYHSEEKEINLTV